jgi:hypothetical protein
MLGKSATPKYTFGFVLNLGYKQFDLSALMSGQAGGARIYSDQVVGVFSGDNSHPSTWWLDAWTPENTNTKVPRIWNDVSSNSDPRNIMSDYWLFSTDFLRMKNLQLGYSIPPNVLKAANISRLRVFYSVENLFTIDRLPFKLDPETSSERMSSYPLIRTHSVGLNLTF